MERKQEEKEKKESKLSTRAVPALYVPASPMIRFFLYFLFYYLLTWTSRSATMTASTSTSSSTSIHMPVWLGHLGLPCADIPPSTPGTLSSGGNLSSETHRCHPVAAFFLTSRPSTQYSQCSQCWQSLQWLVTDPRLVVELLLSREKLPRKVRAPTSTLFPYSFFFCSGNIRFN